METLPACISLEDRFKKEVNEAREKVADLLEADPSEIVFTSCGTESDNAAILGPWTHPDRRHI